MFNNWLLIGLLSVATYLSRIIGVQIMAGRKIDPTLRLYFSYVPVAIISALIMSQILDTTSGQIAISIPVLTGCLAAAITIRFTSLFLPSIIIGIAIGLLARFLI